MRVLIAGLVTVLVLAYGAGHVSAADPGTKFQTFHNPSPGSGYDGYGDNFGGPAIVPLGNNMVLVGAGQAGTVGAAYLFDAGTGNLLHTFADPTSTLGDRFGDAIATIGDSVLIGSPMNAYGHPAGTGAAYVFTHTGPTWNDWTLSQTYIGTAGSAFGACVAADGNRFVIGAHRRKPVEWSDLSLRHANESTHQNREP